MLIKKLVPTKFLLATGEIALAGILLSTQDVYPAGSTSATSFAVGCAFVILMTAIQIVFTLIGVNIYSHRINFENTVFNAVGLVLLIWFALAEWEQGFIWYIWGFLCLYPFFNEFMGFVTTWFHNRRKLFEKFEADQ